MEAAKTSWKWRGAGFSLVRAVDAPLNGAAFPSGGFQTPGMPELAATGVNGGVMIAAAAAAEPGVPA